MDIHDIVSGITFLILIFNCKMLRTLEKNSNYSTSILRKGQNDKTN